MEKRAEDLVKTFGFSCCNGPEILDKVFIKHPVFELVELQINYLD